MCCRPFTRVILRASAPWRKACLRLREPVPHTAERRVFARQAGVPDGREGRQTSMRMTAVQQSADPQASDAVGKTRSVAASCCHFRMSAMRKRTGPDIGFRVRSELRCPKSAAGISTDPPSSTTEVADPFKHLRPTCLHPDCRIKSFGSAK